MSWRPSTCGKRSDGYDGGPDDVVWEKIEDDPQECYEYHEGRGERQQRWSMMRGQRGEQQDSTMGNSWDPWATWKGSSISWDRARSQSSRWGAWNWSSEDEDSRGSAERHEMREKGGSGGSEADSRGFGTPEQVKRTMAEVHGRLDMGEDHEPHD